MSHLFNDVGFHIEQSRLSYNNQTDEFRYLNSNLENYLNNIKIIDNNNRQLQEQIEQIRQKYLLTLENHFKQLPNDFHDQSRILTNIHLQRYQFKLRTRRLHTQRQELKRRIEFVSINEKSQLKYLTYLQKQDRHIRENLIQLTEQYEKLFNQIQNDKLIYQQSMITYDQLQIHFEDICLQRSKTEFEIQTLKEEIKLLSTTREFLHDECETIRSTQIDANEYFLIYLNQSILRIREDFQKLNQNQYEQIENEYKLILETFEDNLRNEQLKSIQISKTNQQLENDYELISNEFIKLNNQNQILTKTIIQMEENHYYLRNEQYEKLNTKENELEESKLALQILNDKLQYLSDYDRNLQFELTLYRGVLENEHQQKQSIHTHRLTKDRTKSMTNENKVNNQMNLLKRSSSNDGQIFNAENLWKQLIEPFNQTNTDNSQIVSSSSSPTIIEQPIVIQTINEIDFEDSKSHLSDESQQLFQSIKTQREEQDYSSQHEQSEEDNHSFDNLSSTVTIDYNLNENIPQLQREISKLSSHDTSFTDVEGEIIPIVEQNLITIMEDLRCVFHDLANEHDLVEIDDNLPEKILDRLEFREQFVQIIFENLIRKYLVETAVRGIRSTTLDWIEFRDILFPIITGRYTERHIRKLFDLFDTSRDGFLSIQEIAELLEILHTHDTIDLAQNIINEYDTDHDGKLNIDELIEAFKKTDDINEHALAEETEMKQWFSQLPVENQSITLEVPVLNMQSNFDEEKISNDLLLLANIFKKITNNFENKQIDCTKKNLFIDITNELFENHISISNNDLQLFIQLYLEKKRTNDNNSIIIDWQEFLEIFFPIVTNGFYSKDMIQKWFDIFDTNHNGKITSEQTIQLLRLLQVQKPDEIINILIEISDSTGSWTFDELIFILTQNDQTAAHLLRNSERIISAFDLNWLSTVL